jgi:demethylmenaquinone methyltransferase/2-methoxy-6-polyprenyl-1,4-benzoquinol methylase
MEALFQCQGPDALNRVPVMGSDTLSIMSTEVHSLDKRRAAIQAMFDEVAPRYDLLNRLLSARQDVSWRRKASEQVDLRADAPVLDLCCGTGDQAVALHKRAFRLLAADFSLPMADLAHSKFAVLGPNRPKAVVADALHLPLAEKIFHAVTVSFGLRNVENLDLSLVEMLRVLKPGGKAVVLEFAVPANVLFRRPYLFYFQRILPRIGRLLSPRGSAYQYLTESVPGFPQRESFIERMEQAGFDRANWRDLSGGIVCLYTGRRPE